MRSLKMAAVGTSLLAASCASTTTTARAEDPFESVNRKVFAFNMGLDRIILEPVAKGYRVVTTDNMREGVSNALSNLYEPVTAVNQVLQGDFVDAGETVGRFAMNTTLDIGGFVDTAGHFGQERKKEDFGQTLGVWGVPEGPFLVLPIIGPSNPRDLTGMGVDTAFQPLNWAQFDNETAWLTARSVTGAVSARENGIEAIDQLRTQMDPYTAMRQVYGKSREGAIRNGELHEDLFQDLPEFNDY